jgi:hypothetical protein
MGCICKDMALFLFQVIFIEVYSLNFNDFHPVRSANGTPVG